MKKLLLTTGFIAAAFPALAGTTEAITGCATVAVEGSNYTVRSDVTCALSTDENDGDSIFQATALAAFIEMVTPDEDAASR